MRRVSPFGRSGGAMDPAAGLARLPVLRFGPSCSFGPSSSLGPARQARASLGWALLGLARLGWGMPIGLKASSSGLCGRPGSRGVRGWATSASSALCRAAMARARSSGSVRDAGERGGAGAGGADGGSRRGWCLILGLACACRAARKGGDATGGGRLAGLWGEGGAVWQLDLAPHLLAQLSLELPVLAQPMLALQVLALPVAVPDPCLMA